MSTDWEKAEQGAVSKPEGGKTKLSIRLDNDVVNFFRDKADSLNENSEKKASYQTLINQALREFMAQDKVENALELALEKVIERKVLMMSGS